MSCQLRNLVANDVEAGQVLGICRFRPGGLDFAVGDNRAFVDAVRQLLQPVGEAANRVAKELGIGATYIDETLDTALAQLFCRDRADAPEGINRQPLQERLDALRADHRQPVRLLPARSDLREKLVRRNAGRRGQPGFGAYPRLEALRDRCAVRLAPAVLGDVEIGLVER